MKRTSTLNFREYKRFQTYDEPVEDETCVSWSHDLSKFKWIVIVIINPTSRDDITWKEKTPVCVCLLFFFWTRIK